MILKLFNTQSIFSLLDILFKDMNDDYKDLEPPVYDSEEDDEEEEEAPKEEEKVEEASEDNSDDDLNYGIDEEEYVSLKSTLNIERIKDIVAEIMSACQTMEFDLLENIMKQVVFQKLKIRESFMQEMLLVQSIAEFRGGLEQYIFNNRLSVNEFFRIEKQTPFDLESHRERIISLNRVDLNYKPIECHTNMEQKTQEDDDIVSAENNSFHPRLFLLVTQGILIMKELHPKLKCDSCSPEKFCPLGPNLVLAIKYEDIETVIKFP